MLFLLLLVGVVQTCAGGGVYLPPVVSTSEAHGPLARLALGSARGSSQFYSPVVPYTPVAVPQAPAFTGYSIPSTRYLARPYVQRLVQVPSTEVATAKLQVRRPAIQKQFYDIEQRTIIRPVGSAVVELEEPLSKNYMPSYTVPKYHQQFVYPVGGYPFGPYGPFQVPVQSYPPSFIQRPQLVGQRPPQPPQRPPQQVPSYPQPVQPQPQPPARPQPPQQFPLQPEPTRPEEQSDNEFDLSDTVVVDNPDFTRSAEPRPRTLDLKQPLFDTEENGIQEKANNDKSTNINEDQLDQENQARNQQILDEFQSRQLLRMFMRQPVVDPLQRFQQILPLQPLNQIQNTLSLQSYQGLEPSDYENNSNSSESTSTTTNPEKETTEEISKDEARERTSSTEPSTVDVLPRSSLNSQQAVEPTHARQYSNEYISSGRSAEAQDNQQKLIELLTGQGEISEIDLSRSWSKMSQVGDAGVVRGRVLSVTSAPPTGQLGDERVSTRRVVVSRPIQTLEEVDVHQPLTRGTWVAVQAPSVVHSDVTRASTVVPVFAPTPTPVAYH